MERYFEEQECDLLAHIDDYFASGDAQKDMEAMGMFTVGQAVWWLHTPRGGYGYTERVIAVIMKVGASRIGLAVLKADYQTWIPKWVRPENIKAREV